MLGFGKNAMFRTVESDNVYMMQVQRRLAQNREAARKSRLRKKVQWPAY